MDINKETIKRLANDVKYMYNNNMNNIYYIHDETNILKGYAMIIGTENTPYQYGFFFFYLEFPKNYPYEPPKVTYITNDGHTRFHPNLYVNGKVCLSIINTWAGEGWTPCQNIASILLTISSVLDSNPLLNEPGIYENNSNINNYNKIIKFNCIKHSIIEQFNMIKNIEKLKNIKNLELYDQILYIFKDKFKEILNENYNKINDYIKKLKEEEKNENLTTNIYNLNTNINYELILNNFNNIKL